MFNWTGRLKPTRPFLYMDAIDRIKNGFFDLSDQTVDPKLVKAFVDGRKRNRDVTALFGSAKNFPVSVMQIKKEKKVEFDEAGLDVASVCKHGDKADPKKNRYRDVKSRSLKGLMVSSDRDDRRGSLSIFSQSLCRSMVLFYTKPGDMVIDPFAGHDSRMTAVVKAGRNYFGQDICHEFMEFNREKAKFLRSRYESTINLQEGDSRNLVASSCCGDFTITSPPYWGVEKYGPEIFQIGEFTYRDFLKALQGVMEENLRVLKPGAFAVYYVNDFRHKGKFISFHHDVLTIGVKAGFEIWDTQIVDYGQSAREGFRYAALTQKILPKRHEYGLVFRKPLTKDKK